MVVAAGPIAAPATRVDVVDLHPAPACPAVPTPAPIAHERLRAGVTPEVVVDEVRAASITAPAPTARRQRAPTPGTHSVGVGVGLEAFGKEAIDLGHGPAQTSGASEAHKPRGRTPKR